MALYNIILLHITCSYSLDNPQQIGGFIQEITDIYMYTDSKQGKTVHVQCISAVYMHISTQLHNLSYKYSNKKIGQIRLTLTKVTVVHRF